MLYRYLIIIIFSFFVINVYAVDDPSANIEELNTTEEETDSIADMQPSVPASVDHSGSNAISSDTTSSNNDENEVRFKSYNKVKIIALNKITAKSLEMILSIGEHRYFGNIEIKVHKCIKNPNPYSPEDNALLTIAENKIDEDQIMVFQGWMLSSNIAISTLEHPVYEVFIKECL